MNRNLKLFLTFLKIGAFTFGGGYAMIPLIEREAVDKNKWIAKEDMLDITAISESTPGPIAINSATFVGYRVGGFWGAFLATLGVCLPAFLFISVISFIYDSFYETRIVRYAFMGVRAAVLALIVKALVSMYIACPKSLLSYIIMILSYFAVAFLKLNVFITILACAVIGLVYSLIAGRRGHDIT